MGRKKKRRLQVEISEELFLALGFTAEALAISKAEFVEKTMVAAIESVCQQNPDLANQSLAMLLEKAKHSLKPSSE